LRGNVTEFNPVVITSLGSKLLLVFVTGSLYGTLVAAGEEIGWRGFALPKLLERHNPYVASIILGIFWVLWHMPLSLLAPSEIDLLDALFYGLWINAAAIIYTWLYLSTHGSLLIASLFHVVYDVTVIMAMGLPCNIFPSASIWLFS
jgi:membrane protease YdiL (CAAX protease family)